MVEVDEVSPSGSGASSVPRYASWIGGRENDFGAVKQWLPSTDPSTGEVWSEVEAASVDDVDLAVRDADRAFKNGWRQMRVAERERILLAFAQCARDNAEMLAELETRDTGKLLAESLAMVNATAEWYEYYAGACGKIVGETAPIGEELLHYTVREPFGVVGAIIPSNGPFILAAFKIAPALAAGNTVVVKPHEGTTSSLIAFMRLLGDALPAGVVNVVTGAGSVIGPAIVDHELVRLLTFTGGAPNGRNIAVGAAKRLVGTVLELGGKNANIVFADAKYPNALSGVLAGVCQATGQSCQAGSRVLVERSLYEQLVTDLVDRLGELRIGHPADPSTNLGPLGSREQLERVSEFVAGARAAGATIAIGGERADLSEHPGGYYFQPTLVLNATRDMHIWQEEVFGPVAVVMPFEDEDDAVRIANDSRYGLVAGLWTSDAYRIHRVARQLEVGTVFGNLYRKNSPMTPFGGFKDSGLGRENGMEVLREYTQVKSVIIETNDQRIQDPFVMRIGPEGSREPDKKAAR